MPNEVTSALILATSHVISAVIIGVLAVYFRHRLGSEVSRREAAALPNGNRAFRQWWLIPGVSIAAFAVLGFFLGVFTRALREIAQYGNVHVGDLLATIAIGVLVAGSAVTHGERGSNIVFQLENLFVWMTYVAGWSVVEGRIWDDLLFVTVPWWFGCSLVGGWIASRPNAS